MRSNVSPKKGKHPHLGARPDPKVLHKRPSALQIGTGVGRNTSAPILRVTDVEKQPFRSMGFVSVIIVSGLFALGLPLVLL